MFTFTDSYVSIWNLKRHLAHPVVEMFKIGIDLLIANCNLMQDHTAWIRVTDKRQVLQIKLHIELQLLHSACHKIHSRTEILQGNLHFLNFTILKNQTEIYGAGTSGSCVPLQKLFSLLRICATSASFTEEYAELGTSEEQRKKPGSLKKWNFY